MNPDDEQKFAIAISVAIELIVKLDGEATAERAAADHEVFRDSLKRVVANEAATAVACRDVARARLEILTKYQNKEAALQTYRGINEAVVETSIHADNVRIIAALDSAAYADHLAKAGEAEKSAADYLYEALTALGLNEKDAQEIMAQVLTFFSRSDSQH